MSYEEVYLDNGSHGYDGGLRRCKGLGTGTVAEGWLQDAVRFWQQQSDATAIQSPPRLMD